LMRIQILLRLLVVQELKLLLRNRFHRFFAEIDGKWAMSPKGRFLISFPMATSPTEYNPLIGR